MVVHKLPGSCNRLLNLAWGGVDVVGFAGLGLHSFVRHCLLEETIVGGVYSYEANPMG